MVDEASSNSESAEGEQSALLHNTVNPTMNYLSVDTDASATGNSVEDVATRTNPTATSESGIV